MRLTSLPTSSRTLRRYASRVISLMVAAALAGLVGTPHCLAMCGGFAAASAGSGGQLAWSLGRLTTYAIAGALVAAIGMMIPGPQWLPGVIAGAMLLWIVLGLAGVVRTPTAHPFGVARIATRAAGGRGIAHRFGFGMATGLLPCGLVYAALSMSLAAGSAAAGAAVMIAFGAATVPGLALLSMWAQRVALTTMARRRVFAAVLLIVGSASIAMRSTGAHEHTAATHARSHHVSGEMPTR